MVICSEGIAANLVATDATVPLAIILKTVHKENYTVSIRANADGSQLQLEWINKAVLQYPTATIYQGLKLRI